MICASDDGSPRGIAQVNDDGNLHFMIWSPSQRLGSGNSLGQQREKSRVYIRGLRERMRLHSQDNTVWEHRRIVLSADILLCGGLTKDGGTTYYRNTDTDRIPLSGIQSLMTGNPGIDYDDTFFAKFSKSECKVHYDKIDVIDPHGSGNFIRHKKYWHQFNAMATYADIEQGSQTSFSGQLRANLGLANVYVIDFFRSSGNTESYPLDVEFEPTWYWHE